MEYGNYFDEWENTRFTSPFIDENDLKQAYMRREITGEGAWETLCRAFGYFPSQATITVVAWEKERGA